jgi:hypothetical protein
MISISSRSQADIFDGEFGPIVDIFTFGGAVPASLAEVPFNLWQTVLDHPIYGDGRSYDTYDMVNIYNNMLSRTTARITNSDDEFIGYDQIQIQSESNLASFPKLSFRDYGVRKYRHIPQTVTSDLVQHDEYTGTDRSSTPRNFTHIFYPTGEDSDVLLSFVATFDDDRENGFFLEMDFGYEASINEVEYRGRSSDNFRGDMTISYWDESLNAGAGDWVLFHTHTMDLGRTNQIIELPGEMITQRVRVFWPEGSTGNTYLQTISFLGPDPVSMPLVSEPITWALMIPRTPLTSAFREVNSQAPIALLTAGGPVDQQELMFSQQVSQAGQANNLVSGRLRFLSKEV